MLKRKTTHDDPQATSVELSKRQFIRNLTLGTAMTLTTPILTQAAERTVEPAKTHGRRTVRLSIHKNKSSHHPRHHRHRQHAETSSFLQSSLAAPWISPEPRQFRLAGSAALPEFRALALQNPHTGDNLSLTYFEQGDYLHEALSEISYLLRDYRTGDVHPIDPLLLDQLHDLKHMLGFNRPFSVICGYRSPATNAQLHAERAGVASNSFHMYGRAIDIRIEGIELSRAYNAAIAMHRGGVGYYPRSQFLHLDTGDVRTWQS